MQLPQQLLQDLRPVPGFDEASFIAAHQYSAVTSIRKHPVKGHAAPWTGDKVQWCDTGLYLPDRPVFTLDPAYHAGAYYVQEASSMFLHHVYSSVISSDTPVRVLDLCAAPGGKTTLLASLLSKESLLVSNEVIRSRASILEENALRWGYMNNWVTCNDPRDFGRIEGYFDVIVIDAPCSGSGLFRKDAAALNEWSEETVALCSGRQQRILADVWPALKTGGILIYATCSFSPAEDELILDHLAGEYEVESVRVPLIDSWGIVESTSPAHQMTGYRFFPGSVRGEGFFIAAVKKNEPSNTIKPPKFKPGNMSKIKQQAGHLLRTDNVQYIQRGKDEVYNAIHAEHEPDWQLLHKLLYFRKAGIELGTPSPKDWIPSHDIALSIDASPTLPSVQVTKEQALKYLKREDMQLDSVPTGWNVVQYNNLGLGWIKAMPNRINNHLPRHWRIRMEIDAADNE